MKLFRILGSACLALTMVGVARAENINFNTTVNASDPTQVGRISRSNGPQDWVTSKSFPGVINDSASNTPTTYSYRVIQFASSLFTGGQYVEIESYEPTSDPQVVSTANLFVAAYAGSYDVNNRMKNWLGDAGSSGDTFFDIILPENTDLLLVVNTTSGGSSQFGTPFNVNIDNYSDTMYSAPLAATAATPEPGSLLLVGTGLVGMVTGVRRRRKTA